MAPGDCGIVIPTAVLIMEAAERQGELGTLDHHSRFPSCLFPSGLLFGGNLRRPVLVSAQFINPINEGSSIGPARWALR